jgi:ketosteroid isomerase-like protein
MSGGHFDYLQHRFEWEIIEPIQEWIDRNGKEKTKEELEDSGFRWYDDDEDPQEKFHYKYPDDIIAEFKNAVHHLKMAQIYTQRIDWLVSGDDGEDSFRERLKEDLEEYKNKQHG